MAAEIITTTILHPAFAVVVGAVSAITIGALLKLAGWM